MGPHAGLLSHETVAPIVANSVGPRLTAHLIRRRGHAIFRGCPQAGSAGPSGAGWRPETARQPPRQARQAADDILRYRPLTPRGSCRLSPSFPQVRHSCWSAFPAEVYQVLRQVVEVMREGKVTLVAQDPKRPMAWSDRAGPSRSAGRVRAWVEGCESSRCCDSTGRRRDSGHKDGDVVTLPWRAPNRVE